MGFLLDRPGFRFYVLLVALVLSGHDVFRFVPFGQFAWCWCFVVLVD